MSQTSEPDRGGFAELTEQALERIAPDLSYTSMDVWSFVHAAWPTDSTPEEMAEDFIEAMRGQERRR